MEDNAHVSMVGEPAELEHYVSRHNYSQLYTALRHIQFTYRKMYAYLSGWLSEVSSLLESSRAEVLSDLMEVSPSTIYRWKTSDKYVETKHAERLSEIMGLYLYGADVFGSRVAFTEWLVRQNAHLEQDMPLSRLDGPTGIKLVRHLLDKIEQGAPV
jgi:putative toxin-antitoxin system antitoxin component (TIGR02293 family)